MPWTPRNESPPSQLETHSPHLDFVNGVLPSSDFVRELPIPRPRVKAPHPSFSPKEFRPSSSA
ncbi:Hypothetical protein FKW44_018092 [Caligus rogercresseyi]|uniref:Uncharacterized protein n=1 Tax=Caligus rogercresseyi TaxID=217165 RepID=A0A7T8GUH1_CALRO|nr:Hypothetical protein FKW44_018092 [Caligus rogercresseyi]